jgi:hypothetical protein
LKKGMRLFLSVNHKDAVEDLVAAVFAIDLGEAEDLGVGQWAAQSFGYLIEVVNFFLVQGQSFLLVVGGDVFNGLDRFRLDVDGEDLLVQLFVF